MNATTNRRLRSPWSTNLLCFLATCFALVSGNSVGADDSNKNPPTEAKAGDELSVRQLRIAIKYGQLESLMLKMAQLEAAQNPRRAALLTQVLTSSKEKQARIQLDTIAALLGKRQLARAIKEQADAGKNLEELLRLLQSEDRSERIKGEQERIKEYLKEVERMIRIERSLQGRTEGDGSAQRIAEEQEKLADRAGGLAERIKENEEAKPAAANNANDPPPKPGEAAPEKENGEPKAKVEQPGPKAPDTESPQKSPPGEQESDSPAEDDTKPDMPTPNEPGADRSQANDTKPMPTQPPESESGEARPTDPQPSEAAPKDTSSEPANPVREKVEAAQQQMRKAAQKLKEAKRKESLADQQQAREELEKAKAELGKILKQLREEEKERTLQALEARFRKMLEMQSKVCDSTKKLATTTSDDRSGEIEVQSGRLGGDEAKIAIEAEKALQLLGEEGSSVAFPATVEQMIDDMRQTAERLNQGKVDPITIGLEDEIIAALEELLQALDQAQKKLEEQKQQEQKQQQQQSGKQEEPLVDAIQELKMIKSLQLRVNKRTDRYAQLLNDQSDSVGQANTKELLEALDKLSQRQQQVFEIVRSIVVGKNK